MKRKVSVFLLAGILVCSSLVFAVGTSQSEEEKLKQAKEQIAEDAAFIRHINSDPKMTPDQKKEAIAEFMRKQNEKAKQ